MFQFLCFVSLVLCFVQFSKFCFSLVQCLLIVFFGSLFGVLVTLFWSSILFFFLLSFVSFYVYVGLVWDLVGRWFWFCVYFGEQVCYGLVWFDLFCFLGFAFCFFSLASFGFSLFQFLFNSFFRFPFWCFSDFVLVFILFFFSFAFCLVLGFFWFSLGFNRSLVLALSLFW